jgi:hypothetical protein
MIVTQLKVPLLFLIFNRPDTTQRVFDEIRKAQPAQLFVAADGPRKDRPDDYELCNKTREIIQQVDWDCKVFTRFQDSNIGCKYAVSSAINWFFSNVEEGIILEDDCVPHLTFYRFCDELLERYRDDERVVVISGNNFQRQNTCVDASYYFSIYNQCWGWATWRRAWQYYDWELSQWPNLRNTGWLKDLFGNPAVANYWKSMFDMVQTGRIDTWDFQWTYSCWIQGGMTVLPSVNLVTNIGHDDRATHSQAPDSDLANLPALAMEFPLRHPLTMIRNYAADRSDSRHVFGVRPYWSQQVRSLLRFGYRQLPERIQQLVNPLRAKIRNR